MTNEMKELRLYLTSVSPLKHRLGKLVYKDDICLMFNDMGRNHNYIFSLSQEFIKYLLHLNPRVKIEPFYTEQYGGHEPTKPATSDIFTKKTEPAKPKKEVKLYGVKIARLRNPKSKEPQDSLVITPFKTYKSILKHKDQFVSAHSLIDSILKLHKKEFDKNAKNKAIHAQLEEVNSVVDDYSILQFDNEKIWKMSKEGVVFMLSPFKIYDKRDKGKKEQPRENDPWLDKMFMFTSVS